MKRPYFGWWVVAGSAVGLAVSPGAVAFYSIGVLMQTFSDTHGWDRAQTSFTATILTLAVVVGSPFSGAAIDRFGVKQVLVPSLIAYAAALFAVGFARTLPSVYLAYAVLGVVSAAANGPPYMHVISTWFDKHRGLATGLACAGMGVGFTVVPGYTQFLVNRGGLFTAYSGLAALVFLIGLPVVAILLRNAPRPDQVPVDEFAKRLASTETQPLRGATARVALRLPQFWGLTIIFTAAAGVSYGVAVHLVSIVRAIDPAHDHSILAATLFGMMAIFGRMIVGFLNDRFFVPFVTAGIFLLGALGTLLLGRGLPQPWALLSAVSLGLCAATENDALAILCSRYFGARAFGKVYSWVFAGTLLGIAAVPLLLGVGYERFHGYSLPLYAAAAVLAVSALLTLCLGAYPEYDAHGRCLGRKARSDAVRVSA